MRSAEARLLEAPALVAAHELVVPVAVLVLLRLEGALQQRAHRGHLLLRGPRLLPQATGSRSRLSGASTFLALSFSGSGVYEFDFLGLGVIRK